LYKKQYLLEVSDIIRGCP